MTAPLPLITQEECTYDLIDLNSWNRKDSFDFFMSCGTQVHLSASVPFAGVDTYLHEHELKRFSTILYILWCCANDIQAFRISALHHPREIDPRIPVLFRELDVAFPVLDSEGIPKNVLLKLDPSFKTSYQLITRAIEEVRSGKRDNTFADGHACLLVSSIPYSFDDLEMTSVHRHMLIPTIFVGSTRKREGEDVLPLALSLHHAFADGMDIVEFVKKVEACFSSLETILKD